MTLDILCFLHLMQIHILGISFVQVSSEAPVWVKQPQKELYVMKGQNASFQWIYDLKGDSLVFAKWGPVAKDNSMDSFFIIQVGTAKANVIEKHKNRVEWQQNSTMVVKNVQLSDSGKYGCSLDTQTGDSLFGVTVLNVFEILLPNISDSQQVPLTLTKGASFLLNLDVIAYPKPLAEWFKDGVQIGSEIGSKTVEAKGKDNSTFYRFQLHKNMTNINDTGWYECFAVFGTLRFSMKNYSVVINDVEKLALEKDEEPRAQTWLITFVIIMAALFGLMLIILGGIKISQRCQEMRERARRRTSKHVFQENTGTFEPQISADLGNANGGFYGEEENKFTLNPINVDNVKEEDAKLGRVDAALNNHPNNDVMYLPDDREFDDHEFTIDFSDEETQKEIAAPIIDTEATEKEATPKRSFFLPALSKRKSFSNEDEDKNNSDIDNNSEIFDFR